MRNRDTFTKAQATSASHPRISEAPWSQKCKINHFGNCIQERTCYNCGGMGHLKKNCPTKHGSQGQSRGSGRPAMRMNPLRGPTSNFMPPSNAPRPAVTQSSVQQLRAQGRTFALTHHEAMASNAVVEGMISISRHIARALFDPGATHSFISSVFKYKLNHTLEPLGF